MSSYFRIIDRSEAFDRVLLEHFEDHVLGLRSGRMRMLFNLRPFERGVDDLVAEYLFGLATEGHTTGHQLVEGDAGGPPVTGSSVRASLEDLRSHVRDRPRRFAVVEFEPRFGEIALAHPFGNWR